MKTKHFLYLIIPFSIFFAFFASDANAAVYRYCGLATKGNNDGSSWDNQWSCSNSNIDSNMASVAVSQPAYLFIDGGSSSQTYTYSLSGDWTGSGGSAVNRIYIMPGYAAQQMGVPGTHTGHTGQVIFNANGTSNRLIFITNSSYITIDGYSDPRPHGANIPKFILRDRDVNGGGLIEVSGTNSDIVIRNIEATKIGNPTYYLGDALHLNGEGSWINTLLVEYSYIHDTGKTNSSRGTDCAAIWTKKVRSFRARYNEIANVGTNAGEGIGDSIGDNDFTTYQAIEYNLIYNTAVAIRGYTTVRNNTVVDCHNFEDWTGQNTAYKGVVKYFENNFLFNVAAAFDDEGSSVNVANLVIRNNLISGPSFWTRLSASGGYDDTSFLAFNGRAYSGNANFDGGNNSNYFVNYAGDNFRLSSNAANAINKGYEWTGTLNTDFLSSIISGTRDIGAFEYVSGGGDTTAPAAPTGIKVS